MECGAGGGATVVLHVSPDGHGSDFRLLEWQGSEVFGSAMLEFVRRPDIRFRAVQNRPVENGRWYSFQINYVAS